MFKLSNTQLKGRMTELKVVTSFLQKGINISEPYISDRYDFIIDINGKLLKIQVKTSSSVDENRIKFNTKNTHINTNGTTYKNYKDDNIDFFATIYNNECYIIPVSECGVSNCTLQIDASNRRNNGKYLEDYTIEKQLNLCS